MASYLVTGGAGSSPRPVHSALSLDRITAAGFRPASVDHYLRAYLTALPATT